MSIRRKRRSLSQVDDGESEIHTGGGDRRSSDSNSSRRTSTGAFQRPRKRKRRSSLLGTPGRSGTPSRSSRRRSSLGGRAQDTPSILGNVWQTNYMPVREKLEIAEINTLLAKTLDMLNKRKETKRNLWQFKLPSYLLEVVERESTFVERATGIDASSRIIALRIDDVHAKGEQVLANLNSSNARKGPSDQEKEEAKKRRRRQNQKTLATEAKIKIANKSAETKSFDPLYEKHACSLMAGSVENILLKVLPTSDAGRLLFAKDSKLKCFCNLQTQKEEFPPGDTMELLLNYVGDRVPKKLASILDMTDATKMQEKFRNEMELILDGKPVPESEDEFEEELKEKLFVDEVFKPEIIEEPEPLSQRQLEKELQNDLIIDPGPLSSQGGSTQKDARSLAEAPNPHARPIEHDERTTLIHRESFGMFDKAPLEHGWEGPLFRKQRIRRLKRYRELTEIDVEEEKVRCKKRKKKPKNFIDFFNDFFAENLDESKFQSVAKERTQVKPNTRKKWRENHHMMPPNLKVDPLELTKDTWRPQDNRRFNMLTTFRPDLYNNDLSQGIEEQILEENSELLPEAGPDNLDNESLGSPLLPPDLDMDDDDPLEPELSTQHVREMDPAAFKSLFGDLLASKPFRRKYDDKIDFRKEHGDVDVGQVKRAIYQIMCKAPEHPEKAGIRRITYDGLSEGMMTQLGRKTALRITSQVLFVCLLYSCNEYGLELEGEGVDICDLAVCTIPEFPLKKTLGL